MEINDNTFLESFTSLVKDRKKINLMKKNTSKNITQMIDVFTNQIENIIND